MSRLAREHPEDDRYQSSEGQREVMADRYDMDFYEGKFDAIRRRHEREYDLYGPSYDERVNRGDAND